MQTAADLPQSSWCLWSRWHLVHPIGSRASLTGAGRSATGLLPRLRLEMINAINSWTDEAS